MSVLNEISSELRGKSDKEKAGLLAGYFKTGKGEYGEGDKFLGVVMPDQRKIAQKYAGKISIEETLKLLQSKFHEERMTALLMLMLKYKKGGGADKQKIFLSYLLNTKFINNWDLVDVTCRDIVGAHLFGKDRKILYRLAKSKSLWDRRIAVISTAYFISKGELSETYKIAKILLSDKHDLIHKATGWMLREAGKRDKKRLVEFLEENRQKMPRTALRYAIEKFPPKMRAEMMAKGQKYGKINL
jgi:3-methyladenine DNA glycosylase AlkD